MAFAETFKALSDPVRRRILELLKNERLSAGEIDRTLIWQVQPSPTISVF